MHIFHARRYIFGFVFVIIAIFIISMFIHNATIKSDVEGLHFLKNDRIARAQKRGAHAFGNAVNCMVFRQILLCAMIVGHNNII